MKNPSDPYHQFLLWLLALHVADHAAPVPMRAEDGLFYDLAQR